MPLGQYVKSEDISEDAQRGKGKVERFWDYLRKTFERSWKSFMTYLHLRRFTRFENKRLNFHSVISNETWKPITFYCGGLMASKRNYLYCVAALTLPVWSISLVFAAWSINLLVEITVETCFSARKLWYWVLICLKIEKYIDFQVISENSNSQTKILDLEMILWHSLICQEG